MLYGVELWRGNSPLVDATTFKKLQKKFHLVGPKMHANVLGDGILTHHSSYQLIISSSIHILSRFINTFKIYKLDIYYCTHKNPHAGIPLRITGQTQLYIITLAPFKERHTINCIVILPLIMKRGQAHITCVLFAPIRRLRIKTTSQ